MPEPQGILVLGEPTPGQLSPTSQELLAAGRRLASELGQELSIGLFGDSLEGVSQEAISYGADKVYAVTHPALSSYQADNYLAAMQTLCEEVSPNMVLIGRTNEGRELAPRLAFRLGVGLAQDCLEVALDPETKRLLAHRPVYGGSAIAVVSCNYTPQVAAIRPKVYEAEEPDASRQGEVVSFPVDLDTNAVRGRVVEVVMEEAEGIKLEDARIVVSGGRGLGGSRALLRPGRASQDPERRSGSLPCCGGLRMGPSDLPGRTDRQDHHPRPVHYRRHLRGQPAHGRLLRGQGDRRHQQGLRGQHLQGSAVRRRGRLGKDSPRIH